ncbi:MAG TPA: hypothetical protein VGK58_09385 [Lacipirellulaceae bacterium]
MKCVENVVAAIRTGSKKSPVRTNTPTVIRIITIITMASMLTIMWVNITPMYPAIGMDTHTADRARSSSSARCLK